MSSSSMTKLCHKHPFALLLCTLENASVFRKDLSSHKSKKKEAGLEEPSH